MAAAVAAAAAAETGVRVCAGGDLAPVAEEVCARLAPGDVVYLRGALGAGKTTFVQACARRLGVTDAVTSPTFGLAHRHASDPPLVHADLYRLGDQPERDIEDVLGMFAEDAIVFVEWPELGAPWLPAASCDVQIAVEPDGQRIFSITWP